MVGEVGPLHQHSINRQLALLKMKTGRGTKAIRQETTNNGGAARYPKSQVINPINGVAQFGNGIDDYTESSMQESQFLDDPNQFTP